MQSSRTYNPFGFFSFFYSLLSEEENDNPKLKNYNISDASPDEIKKHRDFIAQESKGYEVKVFNQEAHREEKATIKLMAPKDPIDANRVIYTDLGDRIVGNEFIPQKHVIEEYLNYELLYKEKRLGNMAVRAYKYRCLDEPAVDLYIDELNGSNGNTISHIGINFIKFAIELSHKKGFKGALKLFATKNSPGFYWLAGLSPLVGDDAYYPLIIDKEIIKRVTQKFSIILDDSQLATDPDCMAAKIVLAKQILDREPLEEYEEFQERARNYARDVILISELRSEWTKLLRSRYLYENVFVNDRIIDELALSRLNLPRFKGYTKDNYEQPSTGSFCGTWILKATSLKEWEKIIAERRVQLNQHMEKIKRDEIMSPSQFLTKEESLAPINSDRISATKLKM